MCIYDMYIRITACITYHYNSKNVTNMEPFVTHLPDVNCATEWSRRWKQCQVFHSFPASRKLLLSLGLFRDANLRPKSRVIPSPSPRILRERRLHAVKFKKKQELQCKRGKGWLEMESIASQETSWSQPKGKFPSPALHKLNQHLGSSSTHLISSPTHCTPTHSCTHSIPTLFSPSCV